jgi:hypothetical protein
VLELADGVWQIHLGMPIQQGVNGTRHRLWRCDLRWRSKGGADITASLPDDLGLILQIQEESLFHQTTNRLSGGFVAPPFPTGNPARHALARNFEQINAANAALRQEKLLSSMNFPCYRTGYARYKLIERLLCEPVRT